MNRYSVLTTLSLGSLLIAPAVLAQDVREGPTELDDADVVITALPLRKSRLESAQPVLLLASDALVRERASSLGETLASQIGVSASAFGPIASRPVLRGQGGLRVQTYQDSGDTLDVGALSDDHAVSLDPLLAERIEVLRGPAALMFGNSAAAGAVNVLTRRLPEVAMTRSLSGNVELRADEASGERRIGGDIAIKRGNGWQLHLDGFKGQSDDIKIPGFALSEALRTKLSEENEPVDESRDRLPNSDGDSRGGGAGLAWFGETGRLVFSLSRHEMNYGLPGPGEEEGEPSDIRLDLTQDRLDVEGEWQLAAGPFDRLRLRGSRNDYAHLELEDDEVGTRYAQTGDEWRLTLEHGAETRANWRGTLGLQWRRVDFDAEGDEAFLPPSMTRNLGTFIFQEVDLGSWTLEAGGRLEQQKITPNDPARALPNYDESAFSGSLAALWRWREGTTLSLHVSSSERHPTATELYADGPHLAVRRIEFGDPDLGVERGLTFDLGVRFDSGTWRTELSIFSSRFDNYIVAQPLADDDDDDARNGGRSLRMRPQAAADGRMRIQGGGDDDDLAVIRFEARDVKFRGAEFRISHPEVMQLAGGRVGLDFFGDRVRASDRNGEPLPQIPPHRLGAGIAWLGSRWRLGLDAVWHDSQTRVADNELPTEGFTLLNADASYRQALGAANALWFLRASNLLDEEARRHASPLKDYAPLRGRSLSAGLRVSF